MFTQMCDSLRSSECEFDKKGYKNLHGTGVKYGGNAIYGATPTPFGNINKHHVNVNCII